MREEGTEAKNFLVSKIEGFGKLTSVQATLETAARVIAIFSIINGLGNLYIYYFMPIQATTILMDWLLRVHQTFTFYLSRLRPVFLGFSMTNPLVQMIVESIPAGVGVSEKGLSLYSIISKADQRLLPTLELMTQAISATNVLLRHIIWFSFWSLFIGGLFGVVTGGFLLYGVQLKVPSLLHFSALLLGVHYSVAFVGAIIYPFVVMKSEYFRVAMTILSSEYADSRHFITGIAHFLMMTTLTITYYTFLLLGGYLFADAVWSCGNVMQKTIEAERRGGSSDAHDVGDERGTHGGSPPESNAAERRASMTHVEPPTENSALLVQP
eukprot:GHVU01130972.1.p1 GENE.GHVU01130972.1~~GHVU01130972.1.p1  ORF type:complete len:325 (-),score=26.20 GHVU01130972.1:1448-2422(-)